MRKAIPIAVLAAAIAGAAIAIVMSQGDAGAPRAGSRMVEAPPAPAQPVAIERELAPAANASVDPPIAPAADPPKPAAAPLPPKQDIASAAKSLLDAGLSEEVVKGLVAAVEQMQGNYRRNLQLGVATSSWPLCEFWLASWPELGDMIRRGDVKPELLAFRSNSWDRPKLPYTWSVTLGQREAEDTVRYSLTMERWQVRFSFTGKSSPKAELFAKIVDAARAITK